MSGGVTRREALRHLGCAPGALRAIAAGALSAATAGCAATVRRAPEASLTVVGPWGQDRLARAVETALLEARRACDLALGPAPDTVLEVRLVHQFSTPAGVGAIARYLSGPRVIEVLIADDQAGLGDLRQLRGVLWHEYVHYRVHAIAEGERVPAWLDEGMADYFGRYRSGLSWEPAVVGGQFLPWIAEDRIPRLAELDVLFFATEHARAYTAYAFAYTAVARLVELLGDRAPAECVAMIRLHYTIGGALKHHYGLRLADFERDWQATLLRRYARYKGAPRSG